MEKIIVKPSFEEVVTRKTMNLPDYGLVFNAKRVGPMNFARLRQANYGLGFRMPIMPELVSLAYASLENQTYKTAKKVVKTLRNHWLTGNTAIHYFPEGMFAEDIPKMENGGIVTPTIVTPTFKVLEKRLGSHEEGRVSFSDDRSIRFTPYGFKRESQSALELSKNPGVIALVGSEKNAEKLARASKHYKLNPYFWAVKNVCSPQIRVAGLNSGGLDGRLLVSAIGSEYEGGKDSYSFGVLK